MYLFTFSILLAFMVVLLYNNQIIDYFTEIELPLDICMITIIKSKSEYSNTNNIKSINLNSAYGLNSLIFRELLSILTNNPALRRIMKLN